MELNINELDLDYVDQRYVMETYDQEPIQSSFEDIPENTVHKNFIKKGVRFEEQIRPMKQVIPKENDSGCGTLRNNRMPIQPLNQDVQNQLMNH